MMIRPKSAFALPFALSVAAHLAVVGTLLVRNVPQNGKHEPLPVGFEARQTKAGAGAHQAMRHQEHSQLRPTLAPGTDVSIAGVSTPGGTPGGETANGALQASYGALLRSKVEAALDYPLSVRRRRLTGTTQVRIIVAPDGALVQSEITQSSGAAELDRLALAAVAAAAPYPSLDPELKKMGRLVVSLPIEFKLR